MKTTSGSPRMIPRWVAMPAAGGRRRGQEGAHAPPGKLRVAIAVGLALARSNAIR